MTPTRNPAPTTRRAFLGRAALAGAGLAAFGSRVQAAESKLAPHRHQVRIAKVEAFAVPRLVLAKVTADDGTVGWGECGHSGGALVAQVVRREVAPVAVGEDVFSAEPLWRKVFHEIDELGPGGLASQALAGVDCALWDLRGKLLGVPTWALLGGKFRDRVELYGSFSRALGGGRYMTPEQCAERAREIVSEGFRTLKLRLGIREENVNPADDPALPCTRAVRRAIGDDIDLWVDANNGYTASRAIRVARALVAECGVTLFEEPCAAYQYPAMAEVAAARLLDIAAGEHEYTRWAFRDLILHGRPDVLNPDVGKLCGLTDGLRVIALAEVFDKPISVHNARPTLLTAAHLHYVAGTLLANRPQEHPGRRRLSELWDYFENRLVPDADGTIAVPDTPGLGLIVDEAAVRRRAES
jgi:L-alanine-DL-glutamate epimerase-like enolase superfamily enzyme